MTKDKIKKHKYNTRSKTDVKEEEYKRNESSSDESEWETEDEELDMNQIRKVIGNLYPSKYMNTRLENKDDTGKKVKNKK